MRKPTPHTADEPRVDQTLTKAAYEALRDLSAEHGTWYDLGQRLLNGSWVVPFPVSTLRNFRQTMLPGESLSDAILRQVATVRAQQIMVGERK